MGKINTTMIRFENEFIFLDGEYQFVARINKILDFKKECLFINNLGCCAFCAFKDCCKEGPVDDNHILVKMKYFELYKEWEKSINK
mgnify:CR=1 FL=1